MKKKFDGVIYTPKGLILERRIEIHAHVSGNLFDITCLQCGQSYTTELNLITGNTYERTLPCGCVIDIEARERSCASAIDPHAIDLIGRIESPDKHARALCRCKKDQNLFIARFEALNSGRVRSCGCMRKEQTRKNLENAGKDSIVMGTQIPCITRPDDQPIKTNTSGHQGVWWDNSRNQWVATIDFQKNRYFMRFDTFNQAVHARQHMKRIHSEFLKWWQELSNDEKTYAIENYHDEKDYQWSLLKKQLDAYFEANRKNVIEPDINA